MISMSTTKETMTDAAFGIMSRRKKEIEFSRLWQEVAKTMKIPQEKMSRKKAVFYSDLMLDTRFAALTGNKWDLRNRRSFNEVHDSDLDLDDLDDEEIEELEESEETEPVKTEEDY